MNALLANQELVKFVIEVDNLSQAEAADAEYLLDRIQVHLEEPEIRKKFNK